ncbi:uncharacterized protein CDAR_530871 [Caerostris darwini]|uniref:Uncharacterized protein n=1 Tax=Caerostris darwini TaxID=1538125 RepID=A0AAV4VSK0_9ARAC|nr:uncharacterized protein CDAR_530871 [Caerostris darwini]
MLPFTFPTSVFSTSHFYSLIIVCLLYFVDYVPTGADEVKFQVTRQSNILINNIAYCYPPRFHFFYQSFDLDYIEDMLPALLVLMRNYVPYITLPISIAIGVIGYNIEGLISDKFTPTKKFSIEEERLERQLKEMENSDLTTQSLKSKSFVPKTVFDRNNP